MKLRTLRLHGFKSFADRTEVVFHDGLTAVVGPNGCGKSNISDAIRWVLGEQRASAIRGARMEEAIFQGTVHRRPVNRGSVTLHLSNEDGALPVPFEEVEISRTVYRDGGSEYRLNRAACRLRDIHDLARDTGLGSNAYAIIESRMIDAILSDRAEERRGLFEEAAGIGKYKDRRKAAARRLERAEGDLQRLDDLMGEVESKVRSLARQKGKAERWRSLRQERLDLEIALARRRMEALEMRQREIREALSEDAGAGPVRSSGVEAAEARAETLRLERLTLERRRTEAARELDGIRGRLVTWEREMAVAAERGANAEQRMGRLHHEREEARRRRDEAATEREALDGKDAGLDEALAALAGSLESASKEAESAQAAVAAARKTLEAVEAREREIARRQAQLRGDAEAAAAREEEMASRLRLLEEEADVARKELAEMDGQGDLFTDRLQALAVTAEGAKEAVETGRGRLETLRRGVDEARTAEMEVQDRRSALAGRVGALERLEADREGMDPVVRALLAEGIEGVHGPLVDSLRASREVAEEVERTLGLLARAVVVRDASVAAAVGRWFAARSGSREGSGRKEGGRKGAAGGGLLLLPLDAPGLDTPGLEASAGEAGEETRGAGGTPDGEESLLGAVHPHGPGAPWVRRLLAGARRDGGTGGVRDARGVVHLGNPAGGGGLLERREQLEALRLELGELTRSSEGARAARETAQLRLREAEESLEMARRGAREAEDAYREARAEETARSHRRERVVRVLADVERQVEVAQVGRARSQERAVAAAGEAEALETELTALALERRTAAEALDGVQARWEELRTTSSGLALEEARLQAERTRFRDRVVQLEGAIRGAERRLENLDREEVELRQAVDEATRIRREGSDATAALFAEKDAAEESRGRLDAAWTALEEAMAEAQTAVRAARDAERAASDRRHRLELEAGEVEGQLGRIRERLEGEWARPLEDLLAAATPVEGEEEELRARALEVAEALERLGPVNQLAVEEHEEESARLAFLREQHDDLVRSRNDLRAAIREINQTATRLFQETFEKVRENFRSVFLRLFQGGECDLWLEDPEDPLDSAVEIHASPRGKRTQRIDLLSGGERALTALSLLFGIYLVKPSPFCVLDEVDAPLDESNIGRFLHLLEEFKAETQFVVITHNPRTIEAADWIYGVTMEEPGVSRIVGVRLEDALEVAGISAP